MNCKACGQSPPQDAKFCPYCGKLLAEKEKPRGVKKRGNGQGSVYKHGSKYIAEKTIGYYEDDDGKKHRKKVKKVFDRRKDAIEALPTMTAAPRKDPKSTFTFKQVYDLWLPTHEADKSTINCYKAAWKHFSPLHNLYAHEIDIDDLQECINDCPCGKQTRKNMKATISLIYKYGIPRGYFPEKLNYAEYLKPGGEAGAGGVGLPTEYVTKIKEAVGKVTGADLVTAQCYLGFRPSEFLALRQDSYDPDKKTFIGGAKTAAGKNRVLPVAKPIQSIVDSYVGKNENQFFCNAKGEEMDIVEYRDLFYAVLDALKLENPMIDLGNGKKRHTYTPHSCRHTFADFMKNTQGSDKDKLSLIGHTSTEMLRYYQDAPVDDLRKIVDQFK